MPWRLVYQKEYESRSEAMEREKYLKSGQGREWLKNILSTAGGSSNGKTMDSESIYPGSNPGPPAVDEI